MEGSFEVNSLLTLSANYTNMDAINKSAGANYGKDLVRRAGETANADAELSLPNGLTAGVTMQYVGHSFDNATNTRRLKSYVLTDVRVSYPINDTFELYGRVENLFDQQYETLYRYGTLVAAPSPACGRGSSHGDAGGPARPRRTPRRGADGLAGRADALDRPVDGDQSTPPTRSRRSRRRPGHGCPIRVPAGPGTGRGHGVRRRGFRAGRGGGRQRGADPPAARAC